VVTFSVFTDPSSFCALRRSAPVSFARPFELTARGRILVEPLCDSVTVRLWWSARPATAGTGRLPGGCHPLVEDRVLVVGDVFEQVPSAHDEKRAGPGVESRVFDGGEDVEVGRLEDHCSL
jgi:hypothetical protein